MKVTGLYVYPVKGLRGISLGEAEVTAMGIKHDRTFMLTRPKPDGTFERVQLAQYAQLSRFAQEIKDDKIIVRYKAPSPPLLPAHPLHDEPLEIPLQPDVGKLEKFDFVLHSSPTAAYKMGEKFDEWFSACMGFDICFIYLGDGSRPVLGTLSPRIREYKLTQAKARQTWLYLLTSFIPVWLASFFALVLGWKPVEPPATHHLTFTDVAPFLLVSDKSVEDVNSRLTAGTKYDVRKFRANIVVDGEEKYAEDFWRELRIGNHKVTITANCGRCASLNVDYKTGKMGAGPTGKTLGLLSKDRRLDPGVKWSPIFGRYLFLDDGDVRVAQERKEKMRFSVGDEVQVLSKYETRTEFDWPVSNRAKLIADLEKKDMAG